LTTVSKAILVRNEDDFWMSSTSFCWTLGATEKLSVARSMPLRRASWPR
jgi:hypothetical protein